MYEGDFYRPTSLPTFCMSEPSTLGFVTLVFDAAVLADAIPYKAYCYLFSSGFYPSALFLTTFIFNLLFMCYFMLFDC